MYFFVFVLGFIAGIWSLRLLQQNGQIKLVKRLLGMQESAIQSVPQLSNKTEPHVIEKVLITN
jgi:hypothetical protein